jgi:hypothetical protein
VPQCLKDSGDQKDNLFQTRTICSKPGKLKKIVIDGTNHQGKNMVLISCGNENHLGFIFFLLFFFDRKMRLARFGFHFCPPLFQLI